MRATLARTSVVLLGLLVTAPLIAAGDAPRPPPTPAECKRQVDEVCAKTQDAMALPTDELRGLVKRCDDLAPVVAALPDPHRKVLTLRLKRCRDLFQFVIDTREKT